MKKYKFLLILLLICSILWGCSSKEIGDDSKPGFEENEVEVVDLADTSPTRKIIYTVYASLRADDLDEAIYSIRNSLEYDEWFEEENISLTSASFTIRVKSRRVDAFINSLETVGTRNDYTKNATDVSIKYQDNVYEISALEGELARLNELYENASMSDMIEINKRISEVTKELNQLKGLLREYDSLVDYSEVHLTINGPKAKDTSTFGGKIGNAFTSGWNAVISLLQGILIVISAILPFSIVIIPVGAIILVTYKVKMKKKTKNNE